VPVTSTTSSATFQLHNASRAPHTLGKTVVVGLRSSGEQWTGLKPGGGAAPGAGAIAMLVAARSLSGRERTEALR
jgi:hypothetical protein